MEDYDWFQPGNDWTDRSRHFDTDLDHYLMIDIAGRFDRLRWEDGRLGLLGGVRYTDVQWTAYGGDFVYTATTFRDTVGSFPAGERGITYRQQRSEEHTSELQSLMRISYAVFCLQQ